MVNIAHEFECSKSLAGSTPSVKLWSVRDKPMATDGWGACAGEYRHPLRAGVYPVSYRWRNRLLDWHIVFVFIHGF